MKQRKFLYADAPFLPMMGYALTRGDVKTALEEPNTAVLTQAMAAFYFGDADPIGKMLRLRDDDNNNELVKVTGVLREAPANTHLKFDVLFSYKTLFSRQRDDMPDYAVRRYDQSWGRNDMYTFIQLQPGTDPGVVQAKIPAIVEKLNPNLKEAGEKYVLELQPLKDIHLHSSLAEEVEANGDWKIVRFLGLIGIFVMVIAWINYVNLSTAKAMEQAKEVGVRKVMGAFRFQLMGQFIMEAAVVNFVSTLIAIAAVAAVLPAFNSLSGLSLAGDHLLQPWFILVTLGMWAAGTLLSGFYPAIVLSSFKPAAILKGKLKNSAGGVLLRKSLVVFQFAASVVLIAGTLIVYKQLNHMMNQDIGMDIDQVLVVERPGIRPPRGSQASIDLFRDELKKDPAVQFVSASSTVPGMQRQWRAMAKRYGTSDDKMVGVRVNSMDYEFMDVFKMKLLAGRVFAEEFVQDMDTSVVITESAVGPLGFESPEAAIGQTITIPDWDWTVVVVGVVNDYHQVSLKSALDPTIFSCTKYDGEFYSMRVNAGDLPHTIDHVRASWEKAFPGNPFDYFFLDDYFNRQYKNEQQFGMLFTTFAALALLIGCLGLFGLSAYTAIQRTKEIGIRKVLGSSEGSIFLLLSKEYMKLIAIAIVTGMPLVYFLMDNWIQGFAYRTTIDAFVFLAAGGLVLLIALLTVSFQTIRAARANPITSLRYE
jgi:putative ABC transport system permease protein